MLAHEIAHAAYLDILFENKNKEYGAYLLRKNYNKRFFISLTVMFSILACSLTLYYLYEPPEFLPVSKSIDVDIELVRHDEKQIQPPPPPLKPPPPQKITSTKHLVPIITKDEVDPKDLPPTRDELDSRKIGLITQEGLDMDRTVLPPDDVNKGIIELPVKRDDDVIFRKVEIESSFPGGPNAWQRFLIKTLRYPEPAITLFIQGTVVIRFVVDKEGAISNVEAISGPEELRAEAMRVIKKSGKWNPAIQNGRQVKSYKLQAINFRLE